MHYGSIGMHDRLSEGNKFRWQGVYHGGPVHLSVIMGTASFWWVIKVPYHKLSVCLNFADWARNYHF